MSKKCKGDRKRRPRMQTQVNGKPIEALVDSGALVSVMSKKAFKTVWEHWNMQRLPIPAALTVSGVNSKKIDVTGYVEIPLTIKDEKTDEVRLFTRPVLVLSGIGQTDLILGYDFIQEEGMIIDGAANETYFADRRAEGGDTWRSAFTLLFEKNNNPTKTNYPCSGRHSDSRRGPRPGHYTTDSCTYVSYACSYVCPYICP
jgi:hypothetical protein